MSLQSQLAQSIGQALASISPQPVSPDDIVVEQAARPEFGDVTTNAAMRLSRILKAPPREIGERLAQALAGDALVRRADVAGPGYVNLFVDWGEWLAREPVLPTFDPQPGKVIVEHTSINPNKAAHVGHLRNAAIGDSIARLFRRTGHQVEVHNYIDDLGRQVADTVTGLLYLDPGAVSGSHARFSDYCWDVYAALHEAYGRDVDLKSRGEEVLHALEAGQNRVAWIAEAVVQEILDDQLRDMERFGIRYDLLVHESDILRVGLWGAAFERLQTSPRFGFETDGPLAGCWVLRTEGNFDADDAGHIQDKVLVRSNGLLKYTAKDIAYHLWKFGLLPLDFSYHQVGDGLYSTGREAAVPAVFGQADRVVNVIDRRQSYPQQMVREALHAVGFEDEAGRLHHIGYAVVSLSRRTAASLGVGVEEGRDVYPMAGRQGIGIKVTDLLALVSGVVDQARSRAEGISSEAIAAGAIRYYLLRHNLRTDIVLDTDAVADIRGNTGPYLMYTHARGSGILRRAGESGEPSGRDWGRDFLEPPERVLAATLAAWPDVLADAAAEMNPTAVASYAYELADRFNRFYEACPILRAPEPARAFRLEIVQRVTAVMGDALGVLGVPAPEAM